MGRSSALLVLHRRGEKREWRWSSWATPRPLYGLDHLADKPNAQVLVTEGEKAADAAARLLPELAVVTSPNGSKGASHADWTPLRGRAVIIWPDADGAGLDYANAAARLVKRAGAKSVAIISPPADAFVGLPMRKQMDGHRSAVLAWCAPQRTLMPPPHPALATDADERLSAIR